LAPLAGMSKRNRNRIRFIIALLAALAIVFLGPDLCRPIALLIIFVLLLAEFLHALLSFPRAASSAFSRDAKLREKADQVIATHMDDAKWDQGRG
jgi:hypothetical protein